MAQHGYPDLASYAVITFSQNFKNTPVNETKTVSFHIMSDFIFINQLVVLCCEISTVESLIK
jgi:hypothetical protein